MTDETYEAEDWEGFSGSDVEVEGVHPATLVALARKRLPSRYDPSGFSMAVIWTFALHDIGQQVDGTSDDKFMPGTKPYRWASILTGATDLRDAPKSALIGRECQVLVEINKRGYLKVTNVLKPQKRAGATQPPATPEVAPSTTPAPVAPPEPSDVPPGPKGLGLEQDDDGTWRPRKHRDDG
jgi:hypothetical protein